MTAEELRLIAELEPQEQRLIFTRFDHGQLRADGVNANVSYAGSTASSRLLGASSGSARSGEVGVVKET